MEKDIVVEILTETTEAMVQDRGGSRGAEPRRRLAVSAMASNE
ncbi:hypothetical protein ACSRUE_03390 [Sorangium sp. KYC3313]